MIQFITGLLCTLIMALFARGAAKKVEIDESGLAQLKPHRAILILGLCCFPILILFVAVMFIHPEVGVWIVGGLFSIIIGLCGVYFVGSHRNYRIYFDDEQITEVNWKNKVTVMSWDEVSKIKFNPLANMLRIEAPGRKMNLSPYLIGFKQFLQKMEEKTIWRAKDLRIPN